MSFWNSEKAFEFFSAHLRKHHAATAGPMISYVAPRFKANFGSYSNPTDSTVVSSCSVALTIYLPEGGFTVNAPAVDLRDVAAYRIGKENPELKDLPSKPSDEWDEIDADSRDKIEDLFEELGIDDFIDVMPKIERMLLSDAELSQLGTKVLGIFAMLKTNRTLFNNVRMYYPRIVYIMDLYDTFVEKQAKRDGEDKEQVTKVPEKTFEEQFKEAFGSEYIIDSDFLNTQQRVGDWYDKNLSKLPNIPPEPLADWEIRIGAARFLVPPVSIQVNQTFQTGSLTGGAIRQKNSPKFNSGHSETLINMTIYFPNEESIWGFEGDVTQINFDDPATDYRKIDRFLSSLRGLITQFKYAPILPIKGEYINRTYGITAVALQSMTISTLENFPYCVAVNLQLQKYNHKVFLPMVNDFNSAMHWGRFRHYMGRAAEAIQRDAGQEFLDETWQSVSSVFGQADTPKSADGNSIVAFDKNRDLGFPSKSQSKDNAKQLQFFFPENTPAKIFAADTSNWRQFGEDLVDEEEQAWTAFLEQIGYGGAGLQEPESLRNYLKDWDQNYSEAFTGAASERRLVVDYLTNLQSLESATKDEMDTYVASRVEEIKGSYSKNGQAWDEQTESYISSTVKTWWYHTMYGRLQTSPTFTSYLDAKRFEDAQYRVAEWKIPMKPLEFDWNNVIVHGINVSLGNNFARLQVQMQDEPTMQFIGGKDSQISVALTVFNEDDLIRLRRMFDHVNSLARLEHAHAVLGFLGIKNVITALSGIKYVLPLSIEVDTIPNYPHVYQVNMTFVDFDLEQQKREDISERQQADLIKSFGKRNPFLRTKQLWGAFNAYPDMPLTIRDDSGEVIGQLDPDYFYRSFSTYDDDLTDWAINDRKSNKTKVDTSSNIPVLGGIIDAAPKNDHSESILDIWGGGDQTPATSADADQKDSPETKPKTKDDEEVASRYSNPKELNYFFLSDSTDKMDGLKIDRGDVTVGAWDLIGGQWAAASSAAPVYDDVPEYSLTKSINEDDDAGKRMTPFSEYGNAYSTSKNVNAGDPSQQFENMMKDAKYRDISGRMVRAFPTYMLWLIDEGGRYAGVKLFDNFYGLQSVIDLSLHSSEDILGDTLVLQLSNLYKKLTTPYNNGTVGADDDETNMKDFIDMGFIRSDNLISGTQDIVRYMETVRLKPGVRVHLRLGYSANPNSLETVFNGVITEVEYGDIVKVTAQSDAIELSAYINSTNKNGHSGKLDGGLLTSLWLSEPRDLMVRLLSMGSSTFRENLAHALNGMIFSENRFGIRHFGHILYEPMGKEEAEKHNDNYNRVKSATDQFMRAADYTLGGAGTAPGDADTSQAVTGLGDLFSSVTTGGFDAMFGEVGVRGAQFPLVQMMMANFFRKRDYELYKRNIYPGNGTGVAQFLGGDFPEAGLVLAAAYSTDTENFIKQTQVEIEPQYRDQSRATNLEKNTRLDKTKDQNESQTNTDPNAVTPTETEAYGDAANKEAEAIGQASDDRDAGTKVQSMEAIADVSGLVGSGWDLFKGIARGEATNPVLQAMGLTGQGNGDDDLQGFDEVSFRASTYMKTVWDMFQLCSALLPNYIVAVRPFEDRSTVFYGKPHWLYTSGVIPISKGLEKTQNDANLEPDQELKDILRQAAENANPLADLEEQLAFRKELDTISPFQTTAGTEAPTTGAGATSDGTPQIQDVSALPLRSADGKVTVPVRSGSVAVGFHLPTAPSLAEDKKKHKQVDGLGNLAHPRFLKTSSDHNKLKDANSKIAFGQDPGSTSTSVGGVSFGIPVAGAMGFFDKEGFGPEEEQYYIAMFWPTETAATSTQAKGEQKLSGNKPTAKIKVEDYRGRRVAVYNQRTKKTVVCAIGDTPNIRGYAAVISPDTFKSLDAKVGDECVFGFVEGKAKLGPLTAAATGAAAAAGAKLANIANTAFGNKTNPPTDGNTTNTATTTGQGTTTGPARTGDPLAPNPTKPASSSVDMKSDIYGGIYLNEAEIIKELEKIAADELADTIFGDGGSSLNPESLVDRAITSFMKGGGLPASSADFTPEIDAQFWEPGGLYAKPYLLDPVGHFARRLIDRHYNSYWEKNSGDNGLTGSANGDWGQVFPDLGALGDLAKDKFMVNSARTGDVDKPELKYLDIDGDGKLTEDEITSGSILKLINEAWNDFRKYWMWDSVGGVTVSVPGTDVTPVDNAGAISTNEVQEVYKNVDTKWGNYAWNIDYPADDEKGKKMGTTLLNAYKRFLWQHAYSRAWLPVVLNVKTDNTSLGSNDADMPDGGNKDLLWNFRSSLVTDGWGKFLEITAEVGDKDWPKILDVNGQVSAVSGKKITEADLDDSHPATKMLSWLRENAKPGQKTYDPIGQAIDTLSNAYDATIGRILDVAGNLLQGVLAQFRMQLTTLGNGLNMVGNMQRQAQVLNKVLNDSLYYSAGSAGSLVRHCDNPFTREYGEPVVEVREPFQRMHYISSFNHILHNGIQESTIDVPTVVTATSDGKYPVTVHFDKGLSSERQVEKAVETGLVWDNFHGSGFFSFLHPLLNPMETARGLLKTGTGSSDELLSKRVALWHLKEGLKDIYQGEIIVLGDADIRPHDLLYIADVYTRVYGMCEVEAVTHHFTSDQGFITAIRPNAIVTVNDPARWSMISWARSLFDTKNLRDDARSLLEITADTDSWVHKSKYISDEQLAEALQTQMMGHIQYTQGSSAIVKDLTAAKSTGLMASSAERAKWIEDKFNSGAVGEFGTAQKNAANDPLATAQTATQFFAGFNPFSNLIVNDWAWNAWDWVRDNLLDQHGCYIQYLTKDGQPMDAGFSYSQGTAVGMHHSLDILPGILGVNTYVEVDGHKRITVNDMLSALGWNEVDVSAQYKYTNWWVNQQNAEILKAAGQTPDPLGMVNETSAMLVRVTEVIDGDTMDVTRISGGGVDVASMWGGSDGSFRVRLAGIDTPELEFKGSESEYNNPGHPGTIAKDYAQFRLIDQLVEEYGEAIVAIRPAIELEDQFNRKLAIMFHAVPAGTDSETRKELLLRYARDFPAVTWDSFLDDGRAYTFNWEQIMTGNANVDMFRITRWKDGTLPVDNE